MGSWSKKTAGTGLTIRSSRARFAASALAGYDLTIANAAQRPGLAQALEPTVNSSVALKIVLVSFVPYSSRYEPLLLDLIHRRIELFCAAGVDCENWELALDLLLTDPERNFVQEITTTSHPDELLDDVFNLATVWYVEGSPAVEIIEVGAEITRRGL